LVSSTISVILPSGRRKEGKKEGREKRQQCKRKKKKEGGRGGGRGVEGRYLNGLNILL